MKPEKLRSAFALLISGLATFASLLVCALILGVTADVVGRNLFGRTIRGIDELSEYMLYLICLLPAPWLVWQRQHIRIDLVLHFLSEGATSRAENAIDFVSILVCGLFAALSLSLVIGSAQAGTMVYKSFTFSGIVALRAASDCHEHDGDGLCGAGGGSSGGAGRARRRYTREMSARR